MIDARPAKTQGAASLEPLPTAPLGARGTGEAAAAEHGDAAVLDSLALAGLGGAQLHALSKRFLRVNSCFAALVGYTAEELREMTFVDLTPSDEMTDHSELFARLVRGESSSVSIEKRLRRKDGAIFWASVTAGMIRDHAGVPTRIVAVVQDITERKTPELNRLFLNEVQDELARQREVGDMIAAVAGRLCRQLQVRCVSFIAVGETGNATVLGRHERPSATAPESSAGRGVAGADFTAKNFLEDLNAGRAIAIEDVRRDPRTQAEAGALLRAGCESLMQAAHVSRGRCTLIVTAEHDSPRVWAAAEVELMGELASRAWLSVERAWAEQALRASEARLRSATEIETVGIMFFNVEGGITEANDAFLRMAGYTREDLRLGLVRWDRMTPPEWMPNSLRAVAEFKATGRTTPYEKEYRRKDGSRWWGLFSATRLGESEGVEFVIDISERKAAEEQLRRYREQLEERVLERTAELDAVNGALRDEIRERQRSEAARHALMGQLVAIQEEERRRMSRELHDVVGQHLTALMLGLKALENGPRERSTAEVLKDLQRLTETIGKEVHDLALELRPTALDDLGLVHALSNYIGNWAARANVEVDFHSSGWANERLPSHIETTIYRIICEALTNALKHAAARHVSVIVERRESQAIAIVEDDGRGFDSEQARKTAGRRLGVTGMRERAALVGGELSIESEPGHGTTVFVRIPLPNRAEAADHV